MLWWTFAGSRANAGVAAALAEVVARRGLYDDFRSTSRRDALERCRARSAGSLLARPRRLMPQVEEHAFPAGTRTKNALGHVTLKPASHPESLANRFFSLVKRAERGMMSDCRTPRSTAILLWFQSGVFPTTAMAPLSRG